ncbi:MAG: hypothetical protein K2X66_06080, partial [Cyanobacteria bacterium]|nr:hypothetical protein [Cyanobacteriota bacterium]
MPISDLTQSDSELTASPLPEPRLIQACKKIPLDRPPVWLMRQAGRYMKEYRAIREKVSFLDLCKTPALAAEVSLQPYQTFGMDGVIMFCDILIPPEAMGMELLFTEKGPVLPTPLRTAEQIHNLIIPDPLEKMGFVMELLKTLRKELAKEKTPPALIGFAGAP